MSRFSRVDLPLTFFHYCVGLVPPIIQHFLAAIMMFSFTSVPFALLVLAGLSKANPTQVHFGHNGQASIYEPDPYNPTTCGVVPGLDDAYVVVPLAHYKPDRCAETVKVTNPQTGATVRTSIVGVCAQCRGNDDLGISPSAFTSLGGVAGASIPVQWKRHKEIL
ncbi:hypothetical protein BC835DRAFT_1337439 [Cytidiella melzeri]|nr:hypothetical protein BC835DRAFT_1337439 [Cytidiella melzeri]